MKKIKLLAPILTAITLSSGLIPMVSCNPGAKPEVNPYFEDIADEQKKGKVDDAFDYYVYTLTLKEKLDLGSTLTINLEHVSGVEVELGSFVQPTGLEVAIPVKLKNVQNTDTIEAKFNINVICNGVWETWNTTIHNFILSTDAQPENVLKWDFLKRSQFTPTISQKQTAKQFTSDSGPVEYLKDVKSNNKIFLEDIVNMDSWMFEAIQQEADNIDSFNEKVTLLNVNVENQTISFNFTWDRSYSNSSNSTKFSGDITFTNMKISSFYDRTSGEIYQTHKWQMIFECLKHLPANPSLLKYPYDMFIDYLTHDENWSVAGDFSMIKETTSGEPLVNINIEDAYFDHTNVPDPETQAEEFSNLVHLLHNSGVGMNYSNYFANVPYADFVLIHDYKNDGMYTSVVPPRRVTKLYQEDEAIDAFMFDLSNNNKIFSDDILQYMNLIFIQGIYEDMEDMDIAISISDKVLHEKNYIDIKMITNIVIYRGEGEERRFYWKQISNVEICMPYISHLVLISHLTTDKTWSFSPTYIYADDPLAALMNDPDWFVEGTFDFTNLSDDAYFKNMRFDSKNISDNWNEYGRSIMRCITAVGADISPYFYDVEHPEDPEEI